LLKISTPVARGAGLGAVALHNEPGLRMEGTRHDAE